MQKLKPAFLFAMCGFLFACNSTRHLSDNQFLLVKNIVKSDSAHLPVEQFEYFIKQKPNRKILGLFRFHLGVYNLGYAAPGDTNKFKRWLRNIGEEPVILDSSLTEQTKQQFKLFLNKNGFFNSSVSDSVRFHKKKVKVEYQIAYGQPYKIRSISYATQDSGISPLINYFQQSSLIIPGERYDEIVMEKERQRITNDLRDRGYYFFAQNFITIQVDSALDSHQADVYLYINRVNENITTNENSLYEIQNHQVYYLRNIYIQTDFNMRNPNLNVQLDTSVYDGYYFMSASKIRILKENVLARSLFIKSGDRYLPRDIDYTYSRLQQLNIFSFINLVFKEIPFQPGDEHHMLDLTVQLSPSNKEDLTFETEITNTGGNLGLAGSATLRNKNLFRGAEVLEFRLKGGLEAIPDFNETEKKTFYFFNTWELGPQITLSLKKFVFLGLIKVDISRYANPQTNISVGYNIEKRPDYNRWISNFSISHVFNPTKRQKFIWYLPDINSVRVQLSDQFRSKLTDLNDPRLFYTYETHFITSTRLTWIYTDQHQDEAKDFVFFRTTGDFAVKATKPETNPSQYIKLDFDFSYHHYINTYNNLVFRLASGYGQPYGTSTALPFEKSFFAGGANSVRAWNTNTLGPGAYSGGVNIEQSGDIKIETNLEFRSEIFRFPNGVIMEAASFVDAGNVWTRNEDISRPGGKFETINVIRELGVGAGIGLRFNFSFFIFRLDGAVKLRNPAYPETQRWVYPQEKFQLKDVVLNFAIGYPF